MSWEWVALICALLTSVTILGLKKAPPVKDDSGDEWVEVQLQINKLVGDHAEIRKLAEETKKLLSQANLAKSMRR